MPRFIAIEHNSGLVWGEIITEDACDACSKIDQNASHHEVRSWHQAHGPITDITGGYHLYMVTDPDLEDCWFESGMAQEVREICVYVGDYRPDAELDL